MGPEPQTISKADALAEAYKRGLLPPEKKAAYEEAQKRGLVKPAAPVAKPQPANGSGMGPVNPMVAEAKALATYDPQYERSGAKARGWRPEQFDAVRRAQNGSKDPGDIMALRSWNNSDSFVDKWPERTAADVEAYSNAPKPEEPMNNLVKRAASSFTNVLADTGNMVMEAGEALSPERTYDPKEPWSRRSQGGPPPPGQPGPRIPKLIVPEAQNFEQAASDVVGLVGGYAIGPGAPVSSSFRVAGQAARGVAPVGKAVSAITPQGSSLAAKAGRFGGRMVGTLPENAAHAAMFGAVTGGDGYNAQGEYEAGDRLGNAMVVASDPLNYAAQPIVSLLNRAAIFVRTAGGRVTPEFVQVQRAEEVLRRANASAAEQAAAARVIDELTPPDPQAAPPQATAQPVAQAAPQPSVAPVVPPNVAQGAPRAAQAGPAGAGQQAGAGAGAAQPILNAVPVAPAATRQQALVARDTAKILTRIMRAANLKNADIRGYLPGAVQRYKSLNDSRVPFAFFLESDLPKHFAEPVAADIVTKLQGWGRARNAAMGKGDTSAQITQGTIKELRGSQQDFLTQSAEANLYKGSLISQEDQILKSLRETGKKGYEPVLAYARDAMEGRRVPNAAERAGFEELRGVLGRPVFRDRIPNDVRMTAEAEGLDILELIERDPVTAAHWLQSNLNKLEDAAEINGRATPASLAYGKMRADVLEPLKKAAPGYEGALNRYGHEWGSKNAVRFGKGLFTEARSAYDTGQKVRAFKRLGRRQQTVAWKSIRDEFLNEFRGTAEDAAAKITRMQQEGALDLLEQLGARGKRFADDIRRIAQQENPSIRAIEQASNSLTFKNLSGAEAAREMVQSPINQAVGSVTDKTSWPMTIAADAVVMGTTGLPVPLMTAAKALDRFGNPSPQTLSRATEGLYSLPPKPTTGNALAPTPRAPRGAGKPKPPPAPVQQDLGELLKALDEVEKDPKRRGGPEGKRLMDQIEAVRTGQAATPAKPRRVRGSPPATAPTTTAKAKPPLPGQTSNASPAVTGALVGGIGGAMADQENPLRGAAIGAAGLGGIGAGVGRFGKGGKPLPPRGGGAKPPAPAASGKARTQDVKFGLSRLDELRRDRRRATPAEAAEIDAEIARIERGVGLTKPEAPTSISQKLPVATMTVNGKKLPVYADIWEDRGAIVVQPQWPTHDLDNVTNAIIHRQKDMRPRLADTPGRPAPEPRQPWAKENPSLAREIETGAVQRFVGLASGRDVNAAVLPLLDDFDVERIGRMLEAALPEGKQLLRIRDGSEFAIVDKAWYAKNKGRFPPDRWNSPYYAYNDRIGNARPANDATPRSGPPGVKPPPVKNGVRGNAEAIGAGGGAIAGGTLNLTDANGDGVIDDADRMLNAAGGALSGGIGGNLLRRGMTPSAPAYGGVNIKTPPFDGPAKLRELLGEPSKYLPWHNNPRYKELAAKAGETVGEAPVANIVPGQSQIRHNFKEVKQRYGDTDADLPILVRENGKFYINDGTHRIAAQVDDGAQTIKARIIDLDAASGKTGAPKAPPAGKFRGPSQQTFAGVNAKTADKVALARAQNMEAEGASRDEIWDATGWFKGVDGKWRFEIDDRAATFKGDPRAPFSGPLGDVMGDADAGGAYPDLARIKTSINPEATGAMYRSTDDDITLGGLSARLDDRLGRPYTDHIHERQHAVQKREDFARGGSVEFSTIGDALKLQDRRFVVDRRLGQLYTGRITNKVEREIAQLEEELASLDARIAEAMDPQKRADTYRRLAGETEARNVQTRRDFTPEQRRARRPWETQDVPDDQQIVRFGSGKAESRPKPSANGLKSGGTPKPPPKGAPGTVSRMVAGGAVGGVAGSAGTAEPQTPETAQSIADNKAQIDRLLADISTLESDKAFFRDADPFAIQERLKREGFNLGTTGPKGDGVDGNIGGVTGEAIAGLKTQIERDLATAYARRKELEAAAKALEQQAAFERTRPTDEQQQFRDFAPLLGGALGAVLGKGARLGGSAYSKVAAKKVINELDTLLNTAPIAKPKTPAQVQAVKEEIDRRATNLNEFWRKGGSDKPRNLKERVGLAQPKSVPFESKGNGEWRARAPGNVMSPSQLFPDRFIGRNVGPMDALIGGAGATEAYLADQNAQRVKAQLSEAYKTAKDDPSEKNLARVQELEDQYALSKAWAMLGTGLAVGTGIGVFTSKYASKRGSVPKAEEELAILRRAIADLKKQANKPPKAPKPPPASPNALASPTIPPLPPARPRGTRKPPVP